MSALDVVEVDVAIGADGIVAARLLATGVGHLSAIGTPCQLLHAAEGQHRAFVGLVLENVKRPRDFVAIKGGHKGMGDGAHILIPVFVHKVVAHDSRGLGKVGIVLLDGGCAFHFLNQNHLCLVGREEELQDVVGLMAELSALGAIGIHLPHLTAARFGGKKSNLRAALDEHSPTLTLRAGGQAF